MSDFEIINHSNIELHKRFLSHITCKELNIKFRDIESLYFTGNLVEERIIQTLTSLFTVRAFDRDFIHFIRSTTKVDPYVNSPLYRIRKLTTHDIEQILQFKNQNYSATLPFLSKESDVWAKPADLVDSWSRLNRPNQSILYLTNSIEIAIKETKCLPDEAYMLMKYYFKRKDIFAFQIHDFHYDPQFTEEENLKLLLLKKFMHNVFSRYIPEDENQYYKIPAILYNNFIKHSDIDAIIYPPVSYCKWHGYNVGIEGNKAQKLLDFCGGSVYLNMWPSESSSYESKKVFDFDWSQDKYIISPPRYGECYDNKFKR